MIPVSDVTARSGLPGVCAPRGCSSTFPFPKEKACGCSHEQVMLSFLTTRPNL